MEKDGSKVPDNCNRCANKQFRPVAKPDGYVDAYCSAFVIQIPTPWLPSKDGNCEPPNWCPFRKEP